MPTSFQGAYTIPDETKHIVGYAFRDCKDMTSVEIPNSVTIIGNGAFAGCSSLSNIIIPDGVEVINNGTFRDCNSLTYMSIPGSVTKIGYRAFANCDNIKDFYSYPQVIPATHSAAFDGTGFTTLHVPETSIDEYRTTAPWNELFGNIVAIKPMHTLTYKVDGEVYKSFELEEGATITVVSEPTKDGYTFSGWGEIPTFMPTYDVSVEGSFAINKYTLVYEVDGEVYKTYKIEYGATITEEEEPTKESFIFSGWSEIPATMPSHDVTVSGTFTKGYILTYIVDGNVYKTVELQPGAAITPEKELTKEGYTFSGWSEIPETMPEKHVTITGVFVANKYVLTYMVDEEAYKTFDVEYGTTIIPETTPTKKGYTFSGWSEIPATMPAKDVIVTGSFTRNILTPSYKRNLSSQTTAVSSIIIGSFVQKSVGFNLSNNGKESINVTKLVVKNPDNNYSVVSTSTDASLLGKLDGGNSIGLSVNLNADFTPCYEWHYTYKGKDFVFCSDTKDPAYNHDITYYVDDKVYVTYEPELGEEIVPEAEPTKEHYTFSGWSEIPATMPNKDVTVKGSFIADKFTLTYKVDGETYKTYEVEYGADITAETEPTKEGYTFSGWSEIPATMPAKDVTITGSFTFVDAIKDVIADDSEYKIFTPDGKPVETLQKGVNIIRYSDGQTKKVLVK